MAFDFHPDDFDSGDFEADTEPRGRWSGGGIVDEGFLGVEEAPTVLVRAGRRTAGGLGPRRRQDILYKRRS